VFVSLPTTGPNFRTGAIAGGVLGAIALLLVVIPRVVLRHARGSRKRRRSLTGIVNLGGSWAARRCPMERVAGGGTGLMQMSEVGGLGKRRRSADGWEVEDGMGGRYARTRVVVTSFMAVHKLLNQPFWLPLCCIVMLSAQCSALASYSSTG
jgi:hypothetical protein